MSIRGSLETMPLPDLVQWLGVNKKTGVLQLLRGRVGKDIYLENGQIKASGSNDPREYMGQFFISFGKLTEDDLIKAYTVQRETHVYLGKILVMIGKATEAQVQKVLAHKTRETVLDCFLWKEGLFAFEPKNQALSEARVEINLPFEEVLQEGRARRKEWDDIQGTIPTSEVTLVLLKQAFPAGFPDKKDDRRLAELLEAGKKIPDISLDFHMGEFLVTKKIFQWVQNGWVRVEGVPAAPAKGVDRHQLNKQAKEAAASGNSEEALRATEKLLEIDPANEEAMKMMETAREKLKNDLTQSIDEEAVPILLADLNKLDPKMFSVEEGFLLSRVNGTWAIQEIVQICPFPREKVLASLKKFREKKIIRF